MGLPSGQAVARLMGLEPIGDDKLHVGKATEDAQKKNENPLLVDLDPDFRNNAPLWYYVLAEAQQAFVHNNTPLRLGPVGGRIVGEVFVGLLSGDGHSYLQLSPDWRPIEDFCLEGKFGIVELIQQAKQAAEPA